MSTPIYLDFAAATPLDDRALTAMKPYLADQFYNPSAVYQSARNVRRDLEDARARVADVLGAKDQEIIFTAGGTEANNLAIEGIMSQFPEGNIVVSSIEHESVLEPANRYKCRIAPVTEKGFVDVDKLEKLIDEKTVLISVMYANNEIGTIQPIKEIASLIAKKRSQRANYSLPTSHYPLILHTDACQAANFLDLHVSRLGIDLMTLNGGKIYAAKQSGCLYVRAGVELEPLVRGGGQESSLRSGTENVSSIMAFATMLQNVQAERKEESARLKDLSDSMFTTLSQNIPNLTLNGDSQKRLPNNLNILIPGIDGERVLLELDEAGVMVATGSACTASNDAPSHVLLAIGLKEAEANSSLRITLGRTTTSEQITKVAQIISSTINAHVSLL